MPSQKFGISDQVGIGDIGREDEVKDGSAGLVALQVDVASAI